MNIEIDFLHFGLLLLTAFLFYKRGEREDWGFLKMLGYTRRH
ncbi:hypothetical protein [Alteribacter salitolerans]|nr:hypothetical protein [Alteribacter salitolerans]